jgi:hypothetical protein
MGADTGLSDMTFGSVSLIHTQFIMGMTYAQR